MQSDVPKLSRHALRSAARALARPRALLGGAIDRRLRELISLHVSSVNRCPVCARVHAAVGRAAGLDAADVEAARAGDIDGRDPRTRAALRYAELRTLGLERDYPADVEALARWFTPAQRAEIRAVTDIFTFTNRFNNTWHALLRPR